MADPALTDRIQRSLDEDKARGCTCQPLVKVEIHNDRTEMVIVHADWCGWQTRSQG